MEGRKSDLLSLPLEPLSQIISFLDWPNTIALWLCGNEALNWRLSSGKAIRTVDISTSGKKCVQWPHLIVQLAGVEAFSYISIGKHADDVITSAQLLTLPRNLKSLTISAAHDVDATQTFFGTSASHFTNLHALKFLSMGNKPLISFELPRTLQILHLGSWLKPVSGMSISLLPPYLVSLRLFAQTFVRGEDGVRFPESLESLHLYVRATFDVVQLLNDNLRDISLYSAAAPYCRVGDWSVFSRLPLKNLSMSLYDSFDEKEAMQLPKSLTVLSLSNIRSEKTPEWCVAVLKALPQNLTTLRGVWPAIITPDIAKSMQRTLIWTGSENIEGKALAFMPSNTQRVNLVENLDLDDISTIPPQLQFLAISALTETIAALLPHTLDRLILFDSAAVLTRGISKLLPRNLTTLTIHGVVTGTTRSMDSLEAVIDLPPLLEHLNIPGNSDHAIPVSTPPESSQWLPKGLESLTLGHLDIFPSEWISGLPKKLRTLVLHCVALPTGPVEAWTSMTSLLWLTFRLSRTAEDHWAHVLDFLPPLLQEFTLHVSEQGAQTALTNDSFQRLPLSMLSLKIPVSRQLDNSCHKHLPNFYHLSWSSTNDGPLWFSRH